MSFPGLESDGLLDLRDVADNRFRPSIHVGPWTVAHAVLIGCHVQDVTAFGLRMNHRVFGLAVRDNDYPLITLTITQGGQRTAQLGAPTELSHDGITQGEPTAGRNRLGIGSEGIDINLLTNLS